MRDETLVELREQINTLDAGLVDLLNRRAQVAVQIGKAKNAEGTPIYDEARERTVIDAAQRLNGGPLSDESIAAVFKEIIAACRAIQQ